ncbi:hypothetical protein PLICRDRAFT_178818 [Plicaturopsis crispa FD-325 SS-3]|uniref:Uncharacterized protein n=1 Tax=Plicaturopsis crispa FD-325 SS-3 TaxID=944288 RepID=A0A0C9T9V5_PLICR|nr:hypothetical protein PLICRDRAFT_178818 [Plicaturopsis crispa FD-325 SS-3]
MTRLIIGLATVRRGPCNKPPTRTPNHASAAPEVARTRKTAAMQRARAKQRRLARSQKRTAPTHKTAATRHGPSSKPPAQTPSASPTPSPTLDGAHACARFENAHAPPEAARKPATVPQSQRETPNYQRRHPITPAQRWRALGKRRRRTRSNNKPPAHTRKTVMARQSQLRTTNADAQRSADGGSALGPNNLPPARQQSSSSEPPTPTPSAAPEEARTRKTAATAQLRQCSARGRAHAQNGNGAPRSQHCATDAYAPITPAQQRNARGCTHTQDGGATTPAPLRVLDDTRALTILDGTHALRRSR